jgi:hypothetical protein
MNPAKPGFSEVLLPCDGPERRLAKLGGYAQAIYLLALRESKQSGGWFCEPAHKIAPYFGCLEVSVQRNCRALVEAGFFEKVRKTGRSGVVYRVLSYEEWAEKNPGQC